MALASHRGEQALIKRRMEIIFITFLLFVIVLALRLADLQGLKSHGFVALANRMQSRILPMEADRGKIFDRNGNELATDILTKAVNFNPQVLPDPHATIERLAKLLGVDSAQQQIMDQKLAQAKEKHRFYCQVRRGVERKLALKLLALSKKDADLRGLWLEDVPMRVYPAGRDGIQLVGPVDRDGKGIEGIELMLNSILAGKDGERHVRVDASGQPIPTLQTKVVEPVDGHDVKLTIDRDIQHFVEAELNRMAEEQSPDAASAIVMDVHNGNILGMANYPNYDPKEKNIKPEQRRCRAITDLFEPGSIFKVITGSIALETGINTNAVCTGSYPIGNRVIHCAHGERHGQVDLNKMIAESCNIAAGTYADRVGAEKMYEYIDKFGFQSKTGIEFPGEEHGRMLPPDKWAKMRTANIGFGQGIVVTPIQIISAYAAIANDGVYNPPRLVLDAPGSKLPVREPHRVISAENAARIRACMTSCVREGTGKAAKIAGYSVAGKTGTAQIAKNGHYGNGYVASFCGLVPAAKPQIAILVSAWHPRKGQYGGTVSAPVVREIARQSVQLLGIPPDTPNDPTDGAGKGASVTTAGAPSPAGGHHND